MLARRYGGSGGSGSDRVLEWSDDEVVDAVKAGTRYVHAHAHNHIHKHTRTPLIYSDPQHSYTHAHVYTDVHTHIHTLYTHLYTHRAASLSLQNEANISPLISPDTVF